MYAFLMYFGKDRIMAVSTNDIDTRQPVEYDFVGKTYVFSIEIVTIKVE